MFLPPIVDRELRVAARRKATFHIRAFAAGAAIVVWVALFLLLEDAPGLSGQGLFLFNAINIMALAFCLLSGVLLTADCVSEERREGTLGLLFLTDLRGIDVILGKLAANTLNGVYALLAVLPILGLPLLMGGVTFDEFSRRILALLGTMALSLTLGMAVSTSCRDARKSLGYSLLALATVVGTPWLLYWTLDLLSTPTTEILLIGNPIHVIAWAAETRFSLPAGAARFWQSLIVLVIAALALIVWAGFKLPRVWRSASPATKSPAPAPPSAIPFRRPRVTLRAIESQRLPPFQWLVMREISLSRTAVILLAILLTIHAGFSIASVSDHSDMTAFFGSLAVAYATHLILKLFLAVEAVRRLNEDRRSGALEQLLVTPLPVSSILAGMRRALALKFRIPAILAGVSGVFLILQLIGMASIGDMDGEAFCIFLFAYLGGIALIPLDFSAIAWSGMLSGLREKSPKRATLTTIRRTMLIGWIGIFFLAFITFANVVDSAEAAFVWWLIWFLTVLMLNLIEKNAAQNKLTQEFRLLAAGLQERRAPEASN